MKVYIHGTDVPISLTDRNFIAKGGEGSVYAIGNTAYKVYDDPSKVIEGKKVTELAVLTHPNIIKPEHSLVNQKNQVIGYTMRYVSNTHPLCQLFTKAFKQRNMIEHDTIMSLIKKFREMIAHIHHKGIVVVDLNEMNFLASEKFDELFAIDVNSYQTPSFPATAIMDSIRDRHCKNKFDENTDWFSWAIITFQMIIGIHPYKGRHPKFESVALDQRLDARMKSNISVFHSGSSVPKVCYSFDVIPPALKQWYIGVFENGLRIKPPENFEMLSPVIVAVEKKMQGKCFDIKEITSYSKEIIRHWYHAGTRVVLTTEELYVDKRQYHVKGEWKIAFTKHGRPIAVIINMGKLELIDLDNGKSIPCISSAQGILEYNGDLYILNGDNLLRLEFLELPASKIPAFTNCGKVMDVPGATTVYDGVIIQNMLGKWFATIKPSSKEFYNIPLDELDGYQIVDAKFANKVLGVIGINRKTGKYSRFIMRLASDYKSYDLRIVKDVVFTGLNFTVNNNGICALIDEEERFEAFANVKDAGGMKQIDDPDVPGDIKLSHEDAAIVFYKGNTLYSIKMKP